MRSPTPTGGPRSNPLPTCTACRWSSGTVVGSRARASSAERGPARGCARAGRLGQRPTGRRAPGRLRVVGPGGSRDRRRPRIGRRRRGRGHRGRAARRGSDADAAGVAAAKRGEADDDRAHEHERRHRRGRDPVVALRPAEAGRIESRTASGSSGAASSVSKRRRSSCSRGSNSKSSVILAPATRGAQPDPRAGGTSPPPPTASSRSRSPAPRAARCRRATPRCAAAGEGREIASVRSRSGGSGAATSVGVSLASRVRARPAAFLPAEVVAQAVERDVADPARGRVVPGDPPPACVGAGEGVLHRIGGRLPVAARSRE